MSSTSSAWLTVSPGPLFTVTRQGPPRPWLVRKSPNDARTPWHVYRHIPHAHLDELSGYVNYRGRWYVRFMRTSSHRAAVTLVVRLTELTVDLSADSSAIYR